MSIYPRGTREFLQRYWGAILMIYACVFGTLLLVKTFNKPATPTPYSLAASATSTETSTPTTVATLPLPPVDLPQATATHTQTPVPTATARPSNTPRPIPTRAPSLTPKPTKILPTPTICPAVCPVGSTAFRCDAQSMLCRANVGHCEQASECNVWCTQAFGYNPNTMTWFCDKPPAPHVQGVCVCQFKLP